MDVRTTPGCSASTVKSAAAWRARKLRISEFSAALLARYSSARPSSFVPMLPRMDDMKATMPPGATWCARASPTRTGLMAFVMKTAWISSSATAASGMPRPAMIPAFRNRRSNDCPDRRRDRDAACAADVTSRVSRASRPSDAARAASSSADAVRIVAVTCQPRRRCSRTSPSPSPREPATISACLMRMPGSFSPRHPVAAGSPPCWWSPG